MSYSNISTPETIAGDLMEGATEIAAFLGIDRKKAFRLLKAGLVPGAFQIGRIWFARRSTLLDGIRRLESMEAA